MPRDADALPEIPLFDIGEGGALALLEAAPDRAQALLAAEANRHSRALLRLGDRVSRAWLERAHNPFRHEIARIAQRVGRPGAIMLNLSFEWTCTSGAAPDPDGGGNRLLRVLDWPLDGLGRHVVVARERGAAGVYYNVTWPGAVGVVTAMAPGRFAAAINQAPMATHGLTLLGDWARNRLDVWRSRALPPAHLLRQVFQQARDFVAARRLLAETPVALPALFVLSGIGSNEGCVIERRDGRTVIHHGAAVCANAWLSPGPSGRPRGRDNGPRVHALSGLQSAPLSGFGWVTPPILNRRTRLAVMANAAGGRLAVLGIEGERPATQEFSFIH
ncbi:MAG: hypothetical protein HY246_03415 [Proteobacteria bacterium]|nr:hypothetical protein [Pseudomonadota bacterium]